MLAVALIAAVGGWIRVSGLTGWDGTLSVDEARLALAGQGILDHGVPVLPSGWVYTRGLLSAYLVAASFAVLGPSDFAARLPSVLAGTALVPAAFALGARVGGRAGGYFVALLVMGHPSLVVWSRQAWFYALYLLLYAVSLCWTVRAHQTGRSRDQVIAGAAAGVTLFAHELGAFLLVPYTAQVAARVWQDRRAAGRWVAPTASMGILVLAAVLFSALVTSLRSSSLVGAYGEVEEYFQPRAELSNLRFYWRMLLDGPGLTLVVALAGVPLAIARKHFVTLLLWLALLPPLVHAAFIIPRGPQERYGLTLILLLAVLAADSVALWSTYLRPRLTARLAPTLVATSVLALLVLAHQDVGRAIDRAALNAREGAWLQDVRGLDIGPNDLVMSDVPTIVGWYVGGLDVWVSSRDYEKYTTRDSDVLRDIHTGAVLVRTRRDFDRLVARPFAGRTLWVVVSGRSYQWGELVDDDLKAYIKRSASLERNPGDNTHIWRMDLPPTP